jgi:hypothetical protein
MKLPNLLPNKHSFKYRSRAHLRALSEVSAPAVAAGEVTPAEGQVDSGKRTFLRLAGLIGLGAVASQAFPSQAKAYVLGGGPTNAVGVKDSSNTRIDPATEGGNLATIATNIPAKGQATMANSMPVAIASNQSGIAVKVQDGSGNAITSTSSALDVNIVSGASSGQQYAENATTTTATGTLAMGRYGTEVNALQTDPQGVLKVDDTTVDLATINGEPIPTLTPGVLPTTLVDVGGNPLETFGGNLQVKVANPQDLRPQTFDAPVTGYGQGANQYVIQPIDVSGYAIGYLQIDGTFSLTYTFEGSNSILGGTWATIPVRNLTLGTFVISNTVAGQYEVPFSFKYFRVRISAYTSGIAQATLRLSPLSTATNNPTIGSVAAGADGVTANVTSPNVTVAGVVAPLQVMPYLNNSTTYDTTRSIITGTNSTGTGIQAVGLVGQVSDVPITTNLGVPVGTIITEKQFGNVRMSQDRSLNVDIKSADNSGRGVNLTALSEIRVQNTAEAETLQQILDATNLLHDDLLAVQPIAPPLIDQYSRYVLVLGTAAQNIGTANITLTASTTETTLVTGIPGKYCHLRSIIIANTDAAANSRIDLRDATAGTVVHQWQVPANTTLSLNGGGGVFIPQRGQGRNWTITCGTSASSILVSVTYEIA